MPKILLITALESETEGYRFDSKDVTHLVCGIGKLNAFYKTYRQIMRSPYDLVINAGTCGSTRAEVGTVLRPTLLFEGDLCKVSDVKPIVANGTKSALDRITLSTADKFFYLKPGKSDKYYAHDMEAFAVGKALGIICYGKFSVIKVVSDNCDGSLKDWESILPKIRPILADAIQEEIRTLIPEYRYEVISTKQE